MKYLCILKGSLTCHKILLPLGRRAVEFYHPQPGLNLWTLGPVASMPTSMPPRLTNK
jgi:hypothetical protein